MHRSKGRTATMLPEYNDSVEADAYVWLFATESATELDFCVYYVRKTLAHLNAGFLLCVFTWSVSARSYIESVSIATMGNLNGSSLSRSRCKPLVWREKAIQI